MNLYDINIKDIDGNTIAMNDFKDKILLIVNTAINWGLSNQMKDLEDLYEKYENRDFVVLGFPSNQFNNQEPGTDQEIRSYYRNEIGIKFPLFSKSDVNGDRTNEVYKFLKSKQKGLLGDKIKWNFTKFLVDKNGKVVERYAPTTKINTIEKDIIKMI